MKPVVSATCIIDFEDSRTSHHNRDAIVAVTLNTREVGPNIIGHQRQCIQPTYNLKVSVEGSYLNKH